MKAHIIAVLWKLIKDTFKNKTILIQFLMFPIMTIIMENAIILNDMPEHFFANLFAVMYIGMAPLTSATAIIAEEKEKNTLRVLLMCNVKSIEYLLGNAIYVISICMIGSLVIGLAGGYVGMELLIFLFLSMIGHCCSFLLGAALSVNCKNQMMATSVSIPVMMIFSFLPMISVFNETIRKFSKYLFSEQLYLLINEIKNIRITIETGIIVLCNIGIIISIFVISYRRCFARA